MLRLKSVVFNMFTVVSYVVTTEGRNDWRGAYLPWIINEKSSAHPKAVPEAKWKKQQQIKCVNLPYD